MTGSLEKDKELPRRAKNDGQDEAIQDAHKGIDETKRVH